MPEVMLAVALLIPEPADEVTRDRPCCAFEATSEVFSFACEAVFETASVAFDVVEACRRAVRRDRSWVWRSTARDAAADMIAVSAAAERYKKKKKGRGLRDPMRLAVVTQISGKHAGREDGKERCQETSASD